MNRFSIYLSWTSSLKCSPWFGLRFKFRCNPCRHTVANRYELHRCRITSYLLICFLQRLISQNHGYIPPFFEVLHFYKTSLLCEVMHSTFADMKHLKSLRSRFPDLCDFIQDPGHHQQPCVHLRLSPWHTLVLLSRMFFAESTPIAANIYNFCGGNMPSLNLRFTIGSDPTTILAFLCDSS